MNSILELVQQAINENVDFKLFKNAMPATTSLEPFIEKTNRVNSDGDPIKIEGYRDQQLAEDYDKFPGLQEFLDIFLQLDQFKEKFYLTASYTSDFWSNKEWASYHNDNSINITWQCHGSVKWHLGDKNGVKHIVVVEPGDILYLNTFIFHSTVGLSERAGFILMDHKTY